MRGYEFRDVIERNTCIQPLSNVAGTSGILYMYVYIYIYICIHYIYIYIYIYILIIIYIYIYVYNYYYIKHVIMVCITHII